MSPIRIPFPPAILLTFVLVTMLLYATYLVAPGEVKGPLLLFGALLVIVIAFTSVELTLYLLILSTLLSPELTYGGGDVVQITKGILTTTESRGVTLRLDDMLLSLVCLTWLFRMAVVHDVGAVRETPINQPVAWYWLATLFATIAGYYANRVGILGFMFVLKYLEYFLLFYMVINYLHDRDAIKRFLYVMLFTCLVASLVGISQIPSGERVSAPFEGPQGEPNTFGGYLVFMFSVVLGLFLYAHDSKRKWLLALLIGIILIPFAFTESRSSYLAFVISILLFIIYSENKKIIIAFCLVGIALMPFVLPQNVINRISYTFTQKEQIGQLSIGGIKIDTSTSERFKAWQQVLTRNFPNNPLLGVGVTGGQFLDAQYPRVLLETGMIGFLMFVWLLRRIWVTLKRCYYQLEDPVFKGAALGSLCGYGGLLAHAIGANTFIIVRIMEPLMIMLGLLFAALLLDESTKSKKIAEDEENAPLQSRVII